MRTALTKDQLADPHLAACEANLRACVHCGICTATCPTYVLTGDERDGPRGRIVMMQRMLEEGGTPGADTVHHLDRCLTCLGCRSACPSSVDYARLIDTARAHIHTHYRRPLRQRLSRALIATVMPRPQLLKRRWRWRACSHRSRGGCRAFRAPWRARPSAPKAPRRLPAPARRKRACAKSR